MLMRLTATISHGVAADVSTKMFENLASSLKLDTSLQIERDEFTAQISTKAFFWRKNLLRLYMLLRLF